MSTELEQFTGQPNPSMALQNPLSKFSPTFAKGSKEQDGLAKDFWDKRRINIARTSLHNAVGVGMLHPLSEVDQQYKLNSWWGAEGQFLPRHILDEIGIVGGEPLPSIKETLDLENKTKLAVVKDFLGIKTDKGGDPLADFITLPQIADPDDVGFEPEIEPEMKDIIRATSIEDLEIIKSTMLSNSFDPDFKEGLLQSVSDEIEIKKLEPQVIEAMGKAPVTLLVGTDFFNKLGFGLPEFTSRKGFSPVETLLGLEKGSESQWIRAVGRVREKVVAQDPTLLAKIGGDSGSIAATLIHFAILPDVSKSAMFATLSAPVKAAIGIGTKTGLIELLQAPKVDETFEDRVKSVALATGIGALTGAILSKIVTTIKDIPINMQAAKIVEKYPAFKQEEVVSILRAIKENRLISLTTKPVPIARRIAPKGFRVGAAEIEKPIKLAASVARKAARTKEATIIQAAKVVFAVKTQPAKAVKPTVVITKAEAAGLKEIGALGEGEKLRIVANPQLKKSIQSAENEIAQLKTRRNTLMAEKQFAVAKTKAQEIAKKEIALATLKEKAGIKLEVTSEGFKAKIGKIKEAKAFSEDLRNDAISMVTSIEGGLRKDFIIRANKVKTLKGLQKLTTEVEKGVQKFEKKAVIKDLNNVIGDIENKIDELPSPQREKLIEVIDNISTKKISKQVLDPLDVPRKSADLDVKARQGRRQLLGNDLVSLQGTTQRLASELAGQLESLEPEVEEALRLPNERVRQLNLITNKNANEMDVDDIKFVVESLQNTFYEAKFKGKLLTDRGLKPLEGKLENAPKEIRPTRAKIRETKKIDAGKELKAKKSGIKRFTEGTVKIVRLDEMHGDTLIELMTNANATNTTYVLDTLPHKGQRETAEVCNAWCTVAAEQFHNVGFNDINQILTEHTVTLGGAKFKDVTLSELMSLEMDTRSPDNLLQRLNADGIQVGGREPTIYQKDAHGEDVVDRLKEIQDAVAIVRKNKLAMAILDIHEKMNLIQQPAVNTIFKLRFGFDIVRIENYYPRLRVGDERVSGAKGKISIPPEKVGRFQQRTGGVKPIRIRPWHDVFLGGIESDAAFIGMTLPLRNARIMLTDKAFTDAVKASGRQAEYKNLMTIFSNTQAVTTSKEMADVFGKFGSFIIRGRAVSALGFRVSTVGTQTMSFYAAMSETGSQGATRIKLYNADEIARIQEDSALMAMRWRSRRIGIEIGTNASDDAFDLLFFGKTKKLANKGMKGLLWGDKQAIANIYYQLVQPEFLSRVRNGKNVSPVGWEGQNVADLPKFTESDIDSEAFRFAAARRLEYIVRKDQPMFDILDRSVSMTDTRIARRSFLMFRTAFNAMSNVVDRATIQLDKGQINKKQYLWKIAAVGASLTAVALWKRGLKWSIKTGENGLLKLMGVYKFAEPKEIKETVKDIAVDTAKGISSLNPVTKVLATGISSLNPVTKVLATIAEAAADKAAGNDYPWGRKPVENPVIDTLNSGANAISGWLNLIIDISLIDEYVFDSDISTIVGDKKHNKMLMNRAIDDVENTIKSSWDFGTTIAGVPLQAPIQEWIAPLFRESKIAIIREITFGDVENPQKFSEGVFKLFERRDELNSKSKTKRLTPTEESVLSIVSNFTSKMNEQTIVLKNTKQHKFRKLKFKVLESFIDSTKRNIKSIEDLQNN